MEIQGDQEINTTTANISRNIKIKQEECIGTSTDVVVAGVINGMISKGEIEVEQMVLDEGGVGKDEGIRDEKICGVCGDKALGCNFDAVSCESCKAFFRRNALKNKQGKCLFEGSCRIDVNTRRFCPYCRLKKCFDVGMRKDLILGEEEKKQRMEKVLRNRRMNTTTSTKHRGRQRYSSSSSNSSSVLITDNTAQLAKSPTNQVTLSVLASSPSANQDTVYILAPPYSSSSAINQLGVNGSAVLVPASNHDTLATNQPVTRLVLQAAQSNTSNVTTDTDVVRTMNSYADDNTTFSAINSLSAGSLSVSALNSLSEGSLSASALNSLSAGSLSASALTGLSGSLSASALNNFSAGSLSASALGSLNASALTGLSGSLSASALTGFLNGVDSLNISQLSAGALGLISQTPDLLSAAGISRGLDGWLGGRDSKAGLKSGRIVEYAEASSTLEVSGVRRLSVEEEKLVQELVQMYDLSFTVDLEPLVHIRQLDPSLNQLVNQSSMTVLRLIKFAKRLHEFARLPQLCQIGILKGCWIHILLLRSVSVYDAARDVWVTPRGDIPTEILKNATGFVKLHDDHVGYCKSIKSIIGDDLAIVVIIVALVLFSAEGPHVVMREVVSNIQDKYIMLLKHYLEARYSYSRAADMFPQLMSKVKELKDFAEVHGKCLVDINPSEIEPIMLEILDLK